jgi:hypothetical protein
MIKGSARLLHLEFPLKSRRTHAVPAPGACQERTEWEELELVGAGRKAWSDAKPDASGGVG